MAQKKGEKGMRCNMSEWGLVIVYVYVMFHPISRISNIYQIHIVARDDLFVRLVALAMWTNTYNININTPYSTLIEHIYILSTSLYMSLLLCCLPNRFGFDFNPLRKMCGCVCVCALWVGSKSLG